MVTWAQFGPSDSANLVYLTADNELFYRQRIDQLDLEGPTLLYNGSAIIPPKTYFGM